MLEKSLVSSRQSIETKVKDKTMVILNLIGIFAAVITFITSFNTINTFNNENNIYITCFIDGVFSFFIGMCAKIVFKRFKCYLKNSKDIIILISNAIGSYAVYICFNVIHVGGSILILTVIISLFVGVGVDLICMSILSLLKMCLKKII